MPLITDWLMVAITAVYVCATIAIWIANKKSAEMTETQLKESQRQFSESQRLSVLPFLSASIGESVYPNREELPIPDMFLDLCPVVDSEKTAWINAGVTVSNIGTGLACNLETKWIADGRTALHPLGITFLCCKDKHTINISITGEYGDNLESKSATLVFCFTDVLGNKYEQTLEMSLSIRPYNQHISLDTYKIKEPCLIKPV